MKKNVFYLLLAVLGFIVLPSCSKDDDETDYATQIAKTYDGALSISGAPYTSNQLTINRTATNKIQLKLNGFSYAGVITIGDIIVDDVNVTKSDSIRFEVQDKTISVSLNGSEQAVSLTMKGAYSNGALLVRLSVGISSSTVIPVVFNSDKSLVGTSAGGSTEEGPEDPATFEEAWAGIEGDYSGNVSAMEMQLPSVVNVVKVAGGDYKINITVNSLPIPNMSSITVSDIVVSEQNGVCVFSGSSTAGGFPTTIMGRVTEVGKIEFTGRVEEIPTIGTIDLSYSGTK